MLGFEYSSGVHVRRHGPNGYRTYERFRQWLRDEYMFRCVYCLRRERWVEVVGLFHIDHYVPQAIDPSLECTYSNLLYLCVGCNLSKGTALSIAHPDHDSLEACLVLGDDGRFRGLNEIGTRTRDILCLNAVDRVEWRKHWIELLEFLGNSNPEQLEYFLGYPSDLPELGRMRPAANTRPVGISESFFEQRKAGCLPNIY